jgi:hypothetical protein
MKNNNNNNNITEASPFEAKTKNKVWTKFTNFGNIRILM